MASPDWSSLPADLVNRVADCLLSTNDLDCYTTLRAVCHHWRSVTADPRINPLDPRFRPSRWIILEDSKLVSSTTTITDGDDGPFLFVNTATGRFVRRRLPPLLHNRDDSVFLTSTTDGLLVLLDRNPPHAATVLINPFTGSMLRFAAPLPTKPSELTAACVVGGSSSPTLVLVSVASGEVYWADPQSAAFSVETHRSCPASRLPLIAADIVNNRERVPDPVPKNIFNQLCSEVDDVCRCYTVVAAGGDMLVILKRHRGIDVFRIDDAAGNVMERVKSIGSQALFLGVRCLVVDTDRFPTVEPNCAYFQLAGMFQQQFYIFKFRIGSSVDDGEEEPELLVSVSAVMGDGMRPLTLTQLLCNYTMDIPGHPLSWESCSSNHLMLDCCDNYVDYVDDDSDEDFEYDQPYGEDYSDDDGFYPIFDEYLEALNV